MSAQIFREPLPPTAARILPANPFADFVLAAERNAQRWAAGEILLPDAVDDPQAIAERNGVLGKYGQDLVQRILAAEFQRACAASAEASEAADVHPAWSSPSWREAAAAYHRKRAGRVSIDALDADRLARLRRLLADDVTLERACAELGKPCGVALSTLMTAEFLMQQREPARLRAWLKRHNAQQCDAILKRLKLRGRRHAQTDI